MSHKFTILLEKDRKNYVATCLENDVFSQGKTMGEALDNIREALELYCDNTGVTKSKKKIKEINIAVIHIGDKK